MDGCGCWRDKAYVSHCTSIAESETTFGSGYLSERVPVHLRTIRATNRFSPTSRSSRKGTGPVGPQRSVVAWTASAERKLALMDAMSELDASNRNCRIGEGFEAFH